MIGSDAKPGKEERVDTYKDMFERLAYAGRLFQTAQELSSDDRPLLNQKPTIRRMSGSGMTLYTFSNVPVTDHHSLVFAVGNPETGFYQVPILKVAEAPGIDVMVSGTIDDKGKPTSFKEQRRLSEASTDFYKVGMDKAKKVYGVALVPKSEVLGDQVVVGGTSNVTPVYHMIVNGFALDRKIVNWGYHYGLDGAFTPLMFPGEDGTERYLRLGDILNDREVTRSEKKGVFPGFTFVAGQFQRPRHIFDTDVLFCARDESSRDTSGGAAMKGGVGRVGLEVGDESHVKYGKTDGTITSIDGVLALHLIGVKDGTPASTVRAEIEKLVA